jgi:hypothetical protein
MFIFVQKAAKRFSMPSSLVQKIQKESFMKNKWVFFGVLVVLLAGLCSSFSFAQGKKHGSKKMPSEEEMMTRWKDSMTPGDAHKKLEFFVGAWNVEVKIWMKGPDSVPSVSNGTSQYSMVYDGRYLKEDFTGEMMQQPFLGTGFTGYDKFKKKYVGFWIDNMSTGMSTMSGTMDKEGNILTLWGKMDDPMTGEKDKDIKYVTRIIDQDTHIFEIYDVKTWGDKQPTMRLTYTRKK